MKDMRVHAEKLRSDAAECGLIRDLATDQRSARYLQARRPFETLAIERERALAASLKP